MNDYRPISCALHSEYELLAMHRTAVEVQIIKSDELYSGKVIDILTRGGAEYMVLQVVGGENRELRLDTVKSVTAI